MMNPDGSAVHVHNAARPISRWTLVGWGAVGLVCWPFVLLALLGIFAVSTRPMGRRRPGLRMAARLSFGLAVAACIVSALGVAGAEVAAGGLALLTGPLFWGHLLSLTRPASQIRQEVLGVGALIGSIFLMPIIFLGAGGHQGFFVVGAIITLFGSAITLPALLWVMNRFWRSSATPEEVRNSILRRCQALGFEEVLDGQQPWNEGMWLLGFRKGRRAELKLDIRRAPGQVTVEALLPEWPKDATARVRREGEAGGQLLYDPLLSRLLIIENLPGADNILSGLHEPLLAILHAWPDSAIRDGRIRVVMPSPPFIPGQSGADRQTPRWIGVFILEQLAAAVDLADLLAPRLLERFPRCSTEEILAPWRAKQST